jgi:hypothetical protein
LKLDEQEDQYTASHPNREPKDIDQGISSVSVKVSKRDLQV